MHPIQIEDTAALDALGVATTPVGQASAAGVSSAGASSAGLLSAGASTLAAAGLAAGQDARLYLNKSKIMAIEVKDATENDRAVCFGINMDW